eukprot:TRINITY_DN3893_c1_g1_i2.p3 TRINITY_DN3893_c1_g1~~TRINITY_DN3893_c1_g1_i2.p3  ORF type:complete len:145 (-),score=14.94 TRINITY_DN3893_c1_g1_i2:655-1089(-)
MLFYIGQTVVDLIMKDEIDEKDQSTFVEIQKRYAEQRGQHRSVIQQITREERVMQATKLTRAELEKLPEEVKTYQAVGRAYFLKPKAVLMQDLTDEEKTAQGMLEKLKQNKEVIVREVGSAEKELREFLSDKPALAKRIASGPS